MLLSHHYCNGHGIQPWGSLPTIVNLEQGYYKGGSVGRLEHLSVGLARRLSLCLTPLFTVAYIHVQWVELTNTVRYRILSVPYFRTLLESTRPGIGIPKITMGPAWGEYLYVPDLSTMRLCPHAPGEAVVMGWFKEKTPYLGACNQLTFDVPLCPRATLQRVVQ